MSRKNINYEIQELITVFEAHHQQILDEHVKLKNRFIKDHPNEPLPEHLKNDFSISLALKSICEELMAIKRSMKALNQSLSNRIYGIYD